MQIHSSSILSALGWQSHQSAVSCFGKNHTRQAMQAVRSLASMPWFSPGIGLGALPFGHSCPPPCVPQFAPQCGCLAPPQLECAGAPAGRGLCKDPEGFPKGSVRTAGGYTIVPENGANAWNIYGPGKEMKDGPNTRVWGDPHVNEKDGTRWDFTKNSNFRLPDGTLIGVQTTSQQGASVTKSLDIINGADRVHISGIDANQPKTSDVSYDGYEFRNELASQHPGRNTFVLGGDDKNVHWFQERNGRNQGLVTGSRVNAQGNYEQIVDRDKTYYVDPGLRPPVGSAAWGNELRSSLTDGIAGSNAPQDFKNLFASFIGLDHWSAASSQLSQSLWPAGIFGGLAGSYGNIGDVFGALTGLGNEVLSYAHLASSVRYGYGLSA